MEEPADFLWLVQRAIAIRTAEGWTKAERERSWVDWTTRAEASIKLADAHRRIIEQ